MLTETKLYYVRPPVDAASTFIVDSSGTFICMNVPEG